jgi:isoquinoline 1-oxidoreductase beta subunit
MLGGGFGRRSYVDFVREAVRVAMAVGKPVQTLWSREEDTRRGAYRPMAAWRFRAGLDGAGCASGLQCQSIAHSIKLSDGGRADELDSSSVEGIVNLPYAVGARRITHTMTRSHLRAGIWRSVGSSQNAWALESFIDELAVAAGRDPFDFRRELLAARPDFLHVLDVLQEKSGWGRALPAGRAQGLAIHEAFGTIVGQVAEVSVTPAGVLRLERVVAAVDCGHVVNPLTVAEQVESGIAYGLSAALYGRLTVKDGAVVEGNFDSYPVLRLREMPRVETHLALSGGDKWGGIGEPGLPPAAPAVCNAIFRVTGKRIRRLPLAGQDLSWGSA